MHLYLSLANIFAQSNFVPLSLGFWPKLTGTIFKQKKKVALRKKIRQWKICFEYTQRFSVCSEENSPMIYDHIIRPPQIKNTHSKQ